MTENSVKVEIESFSDFEESESTKKDEYYMGTILLYQNGETYEIIDLVV